VTDKPTSLDLEFRPEPEVIRSARDAANILESEIPQEKVDDVRLLVSELVTNAVRHGHLRPNDDWVRLRLRYDDDKLRVEVSDPGDGFNVPASPDQLSESGWGMYLLQQLADRWGVSSGGETRVWFELDLPHP
jgi:anti-sigma regulatory factor (Ser/Thr protein kinase)